MEKWGAFARQFVKKAAVCLIVYDVCNRSSFEELPSYLKAIKQLNDSSPTIMLIGNQIDIENRQVTTEEGAQFSVENGLLFIETSAFTGENVNEAFEISMRSVLERTAASSKAPEG